MGSEGSVFGLVHRYGGGGGRARERDDGYGEGGLWWMDEEEGRIEGMMRGMDGWMYMRGG